MSDEEKLIHEFVLDNVWIGIDQTRQAINNLDEKANNMITISGVLMSIIGGVLISSDITNFLNSLFLLLILIPLIVSVYFAFKTIRLKEQEVLDLEEAICYLHYTDYLQAIGDMSLSVCGWQKRLKKKIADPKSSNLLLSMNCFRSALILIFIFSFIKIILLFHYSKLQP